MGKVCTMLVAVGLLGLAGRPAMGQDAGTGVVTGTVTAPSGPVEGANVVLVDSAEGSQQERFGDATTPDGRFRVEEVPPGAYTVRASIVGYEPARQSVRVAAGGTAGGVCVAELRRGGRLRLGACWSGRVMAVVWVSI